MKNDTYRSLFKQQSTKSLSKYKSETIEQRVNQISKELLIGQNKRRQHHNQFTITTNIGNNIVKKQNGKSQDELLKKVKTLQNQLKRKVSEDCIMRNFFKTLNTSQISHIDIYLQMRRLQELLSAFQKQMQQFSQHEEEMVTTINEYKQALQQNEQKLIRNQMDLSQEFETKIGEWRSEKVRLNETIALKQQQNQNLTVLLDQMKKKNNQLTGKCKQLTDKLEQERVTQIEALKKQRQINTKQNNFLMKQLEQFQNQRQQIMRQVQKYFKQRQLGNNERTQLKDQIQKLQLRLKQYDNLQKQLKNTEAELKKHYQQKIDYQLDKLKKCHQLKEQQKQLQYQDSIQQLQRQCEQMSLKCHQANKINQKLKQNIAKLSEEIMKEKQYKGLLQKQKQKLVTHLLQKESICNQFKAKINALIFERDEIMSMLNKSKQLLIQKDKQLDKIEQKGHQLCLINDSMSKECQQLKKQAQYNQRYGKINDKMCNQNYKALGRLIQINKKIKNKLPVNSQTQNKINEQSLNEVVTELTQLLQIYIRCFNDDKKLYQSLNRIRNIQNRQVSNLLEHCRLFLNNQHAQNLMYKYISALRERKNNQLEDTLCQKTQLYHQLIENIMNLNNLKCYSENHNTCEKFKDSIAYTYIDMSKPASNSRAQCGKIVQYAYEDSLRNINKKKERVNTEVSQCNIPLKMRLFTEFDQKQNQQTNITKEKNNERKEETKKFLNETRQRISNKNLLRHKQKTNEHTRNELQRKYFRC